MIGQIPADQIKFAPVVGQAPTYVFKDAIDMAGPVADLQAYDTKLKEIDQRKREQRANQTMSQTNQLNESTIHSMNRQDSTTQGMTR